MPGRPSSLSVPVRYSNLLEYCQCSRLLSDLVLELSLRFRVTSSRAGCTISSVWWCGLCCNPRFSLLPFFHDRPSHRQPSKSSNTSQVEKFIAKLEAAATFRNLLDGNLGHASTTTASLRPSYYRIQFNADFDSCYHNVMFV
jgi:hypothetical protein